MLQNHPKCFKVLQMLQNVPKCSNILQYAQNTSKWSQRVPNGPLWSKMMSNGVKWFQMIQMVLNDPKWSQMGLNGQNGPMGSNVVQIVKNGSGATRSPGLVLDIQEFWHQYTKMRPGQNWTSKSFLWFSLNGPRAIQSISCDVHCLFVCLSVCPLQKTILGMSYYSHLQRS